ncbi:peptidase M4 [Mesorhizobium sp. M0292]|uniref:peptidase M4 n=1 Tax=Mesorhizobium sp. M0292 TaxID=2956929 RepID=UPI00333AA448
MSDSTPPDPIPFPARRPLKVYAFDPSMGHMLGNHLGLTVAYEPLQPGPVGARVAVVDYDGHTGTYYAPVDLDDKAILMRGGLDPSESDPRFHQQMVYAVASETLERFEVALGRKIHWHRAGPGPNRLNLYPHAMLEANAYYSRDIHGIVFGYFPAGPDADGDVLPRQTVFTCLSHDIIAHEVTHAVIDGIREHFTEPTNIDVTAFHEAFADLAALFRHFSHQDALLDTLQRTGGRLYAPSLAADAKGPTAHANVGAEISPNNPLVQLARQFGQVSGRSGGLRSALDQKSNANSIRSVTEPHARGAILVAAMFDAFFTTYVSRTADLFKVFRIGGARPDSDDLPGPLALLLAERASKTADMFFMICARALDYCPPVDITFGDFLRALITADSDLYPVDARDVRYTIMQAFRRRGIVPEGSLYFSEESLRWPLASPGLPAVKGLVFGDPNGLSREEQDINGRVLWAYAAANAEALGFNREHGKVSVPSFHPIFRLGEDGVLRIDMVVELIQKRKIAFDEASPELGAFEVNSGVTLMIANQPLKEGSRPDPVVRYVIPRHAR